MLELCASNTEVTAQKYLKVVFWQKSHSGNCYKLVSHKSEGMFNE